MADWLTINLLTEWLTDHWDDSITDWLNDWFLIDIIPNIRLRIDFNFSLKRLASLQDITWIMLYIDLNKEWSWWTIKFKEIPSAKKFGYRDWEIILWAWHLRPQLLTDKLQFWQAARIGSKAKTAIIGSHWATARILTTVTTCLSTARKAVESVINSSARICQHALTIPKRISILFSSI